MSFFKYVLTIFLMITGACRAAPVVFPRVYLDIWNRMPQGKELTANCNDLGIRSAGTDVAISYAFMPYVLGLTKFPCSLTSVYGQLKFDAYDLKRDCGKRCTERCAWEVAVDGVHTVNKTADPTFFPWVLHAI